MAITDKLAKASNGSAAPVPTTLSAPKAAGASSLSLTLATGWPTATATHFVLYQVSVTGDEVAGTRTVWKGQLSGTTVNNLTLRAGTEPSGGYPSGSVVEPMFTHAMLDDLIDGLLAFFDQDGTPKAGGVDNAAAL